MKYLIQFKVILFLALSLLTVLFPFSVYSQQKKPPEKQKPKMVFLGEFDSGQPDAGIYKLFDPTDEVLCYVLMPRSASRREIGGVWIYEANSLGSISCVKVNLVRSDVIKK